MEGLLTKFSATCKITKEEHPHFALYKAKVSRVSQAERRIAFLNAQKSKRFDYVAHARQLAECEKEAEDVLEDMEETTDDMSESMEVVLQPKKHPRRYKDQLMLSEWMVEVPEDLAINWLLVLVPVGKRSLIVASKGTTKAYSRGGYHLRTFPSSLPGGNLKDQKGFKGSSYTLLDCIFSEEAKTYYVMDMICWNGHPLYDSESEFRFFWLATKFEDCPKVMEVSSSNPFKFIPLPSYSCDEKTLKSVLNTSLPFPCKLDGLLFFHKKCHYIPRKTPLVSWLKGFMVPEVLKMPVSEPFMSDIPPSYTTMQNYVPKAFTKNEMQKLKDEKFMQVEDS